MITVYYQFALGVLGIIEDYISLVWTEKYSDYGEFELELPISYKDNFLISMGNILSIPDSTIHMCIRDVLVEETGDDSTLVVKGSGFSQRLTERVFYYNEPFQYTDAGLLLAWMLTTHVTNPVAANRDIWQFGVGLTGVPELPEIIPYGEHQEGFSSVGELFRLVCKNVDYGFRANIDDTNMTGFGYLFYMEIYKGVDRSDQQTINPWVVFEKDLDNIKNTKTFLSSRDYANTVHVISNDPVHNDFYITVGWNPYGYAKTEIGLETTIERTDYDPALTDAQVLEVLTIRAQNLLKQYELNDLFEGDIVLDGTFEYGIDFSLGDIITVLGERARIIELTRSYSASGDEAYVTIRNLDV